VTPATPEVRVPELTLNDDQRVPAAGGGALPLSGRVAPVAPVVLVALGSPGNMFLK
jgi:hypothetical protein